MMNLKGDFFKYLLDKCLKNKCLGMVVHAFNPSTQEAQAGECCEFEASLIYI